MSFTNKTLIAVTALCCLGLSGCRDAASALGIGKKSTPDEFLVVSNPPLSVPPNFILAEPGPRLKPSAGVLGTQRHAENRGLTGEENVLLGKMSSGHHPVTEPDDAKNAEKKHFVDPVAEKARLAKNKQEGRPVNEGKVEERAKAQPTTLEKLFG